ncbi:hypothetical protein D7Y24_13380 [Stenotrophomonas maltophilia]|uniref:hypothetical protein n=1 Tax=Stenotrophomonas maltophilia TaxID=40324 RepID=UPI000D4C7684|nr:hypothetical protein [Stenotrophomonas maltophilia]MBA0299399.1 hypothetical protein [Stenotrophomonas maltophilia]PSD17951.1 hypothetical protein C7E19_04025 [Stenotrophomonas maltophilia]HDS1836606.1 hypothetical protein [Stenotrophomonas maltophilia]
MSNDKSQYNGQNGNGYQPLPCTPTPPPGPEDDTPTLADAQPGGRVQVMPSDAARALLAAQYRDDGDRAKAIRINHKSLTDSDKRALRAIEAALSAQPSPGGEDALAYEGHSWVSDYVLADLRERAALPLQLRNGEVWHWQGDGHDFPESLICPVVMSAETLRALLAARQPAHGSGTLVDSGALQMALNVLRRAGKDEVADALESTAARQPSKQPDSVALGEATEFCIEKGDRQPVGQEPVAYWIAVDRDGLVEFGMSADDFNDGQVARQEVNDFINDRIAQGVKPLQLIGVYITPTVRAVDLTSERVRLCIQSLLEWVDRNAETTEESGFHILEKEAVEVMHGLPARQPVGEPVAWMTHHDEPMLFPTAAEAADYCEDDEQPVPLFRSPAQAVDLERFRPAVMTSLGLSSPNSTERETLRELLALIDSKAGVIRG